VSARRALDPAQLRAAEAAAVASFAPNAYQAMLTTLLGAGAEAAWPEVVARLAPRPAFAFRPGLGPLLSWLRGRGLRLGLAANQGRDAVAALEAAGLAAHFDGLSVSATLGLRKPDPRLFLAVCAQLGVAPDQCVMVGDRIDNDIAPARALGMATILFRTGRHARQQPRSWLEAPDKVVLGEAGLRAALSELVGEA
jgi:putative hydrolase of the HAD superfamily